MFEIHGVAFYYICFKKKYVEQSSIAKCSLEKLMKQVINVIQKSLILLARENALS